jgi:uncharacterized protein (TIGR03437 family)
MLNNTTRIFTLAFFCSAAGFGQVALNGVPTREIGQPQLLPNFALSTPNPNLVEGRELFLPQGIALDTSVTPPIVYVSDTNNNRVLAWQNAASFANGKPADKVIGQRDFYSTVAGGPGTAFSTGLLGPSGLAVLAGDLYVVDSGNNRVLRFRKPFATTDQLFPDLSIGQPGFTTNGANAPSGLINDRGIALRGNGFFLTAAIAFDKDNNLWLTDSGNNRVLRYDAADVARSNSFGAAAKVELGQLDFFTRQPALPVNNQGLNTLNQFAIPAALAFDSAGRLYVADADSSGALSRVLVFTAPFTSGQSAVRLMGVVTPPATGAPPLTDSQVFSIRMASPSAIFFLPGSQGMGVVDAGFSRILLFDPFEQWPDAGSATSPSAKAVVGHTISLANLRVTDTKSLVANDGNPQSSAGTFSGPAAVVFFNNELYVADTGNNRAVVLPFQNGVFGPAVRLLGQDRFDSNSINLIEGREFRFVTQSSDSALAIDSTGDTPHLYVSDPYNNRVLGFKDLRALKPGAKADLVIGQPDMATALCNYPSGKINQPTQSSLCGPMGLLVDSTGNLYVADFFNGRVLRFPAPFSHLGNQQADLVLGKPNFFDTIADPSPSRMAGPYGLAFAGTNGLLASDQVHNRVLFFPFTNGTFTAADNGKSATKVFGQPDFISIDPGTTNSRMKSPHHIGTDSDSRPYVVDSGNSRVLIFDQILKNPNTGATAALLLGGVGAPEGIFVNQLTGEFWVTDLNNRVLKFPKFDSLLFNPAPTTSITAIGPVAVAQDQFGDLIVSESANRVTFYFPALSAVNGAHFEAVRPLAPGVFATVFPATGAQFGKDIAKFDDGPNPIPYPKMLADIQVLFDGNPAPLTYAGPSQVNFVVPKSAPTSGFSDLQVVKVSTGQVLAAGSVAMNTVSPAIFVTGNNLPSGAALPNRQAAVINLKDGTVNGPLNPAARGDYISIYATGQGAVPGAPDDGDIPKGLVTTPDTPRVLIGTCFVADCMRQPNEDPSPFIQFSGLSPQFPGVWQINVRIPMVTDPTRPAGVGLLVNSVPSNDPTITGYTTVIYVK